MFYLILFLIVGGALAILTGQNFSGPEVHVSFLIWQTPNMPLGLLVLLAFLAGGLFLYLIALFSAWGERRTMRRLQRHVAELEQQLAQHPVMGATQQPVASMMPEDRVTVPPRAS